MPDLPLPPALREAVAATLEPVRPLRAPRRRALAFLPFGVLLLGLVAWWWGVRENAAALGGWLWALSLLQTAAGVVVAGAALAESVPGRLGSVRRAIAWCAAAVLLVVGITFVTFAIQPSYAPPPFVNRFLYICSTRTLFIGLAPLAIAIGLQRRGLVSRPVLGGVLAGTAAGLLADSSWRIFCEVSDPRHVLAAHTGGLLALGALGALVGSALQRLRS